jgi:hypothetical protein
VERILGDARALPRALTFPKPGIGIVHRALSDENSICAEQIGIAGDKGGQSALTKTETWSSRSANHLAATYRGSSGRRCRILATVLIIAVAYFNDHGPAQRAQPADTIQLHRRFIWF